MTARAPLPAYQRRLLALLSVAAFFEGYDFIALTQILPNLRTAMNIDRQTAGQMIALINAGTMVAYFLVRGADRWGRKRVLTVTIAGYTSMTFLSGLAPGPWTFASLQMLGRIFLIAEYATSMVIAAEEFPEDRRGLSIGLVGACSSLGSIVCAGLAPLLLKTSFGWRSVYFVGIVPLLLLAYARRGISETRRFVETGPAAESRSFLYVFRTAHRRRVFQLGAIWFAAYIGSQSTVTFWKDFAVNERGFTDGDVGAAITVAAAVALPLVFSVPKLLDLLGRKPTAALVFLSGALGTVGCYTFHGRAALTASLVLGVFAASAFLPVLNALTTELFPTEIRAEGYAWANNVIGRIGYVLSPLVVGWAAEKAGWGPVVRLTAVGTLASLALVYLMLPETKNRTLEETSRL
ncbi:MAG TPA: MFS transporter [Polyangiaceae bacterium]|jgi:putative MFS transporter|nr:MFS transporter [Polyangiaceae bacterium]